MEVVVLILKGMMWCVVGVMVIYSIRHVTFTYSRILGEQKLYYQDIVDSDLLRVTVLIPMHNEERVATDILTALLDTDYPPDLLEIIPVNDHSEDKTREILDRFARKHPHIRPFHRYEGMRGKPAALNDAMKVCTGDIVVVFDADYLPPRGMIRDLTVCFKDPEVGAVMGRVVPVNTGVNLLTRLLDMERAGGYQVDQQARYSLGLAPQYGGTVGGFRKDLALLMGGFDPHVLSEDTDLTYNLFVRGWKVVYANRLECYEESPEEWGVRAKQIRRWAIGHTQTMFKYMAKTLFSRHLSFKEKLDGLLLLTIYLIPLTIVVGAFVSFGLFFLGEMNLLHGLIFFCFVVAFNAFGNFAPFYEIAAGSLLDGSGNRMKMLPLFLYNFVFNTWVIAGGAIRGVITQYTGKAAGWHKTERFRGAEAAKEDPGTAAPEGTVAVPVATAEDHAHGGTAVSPSST